MPTKQVENNPEAYDNEGSIWDSRKARINGTSSYMPAMFGMTITSLVVKAIMNEK